MVTKHSTARSLLFGGSEYDLMDRPIGIVVDGQITISFNDFVYNDFGDLPKDIPEDDFKAIVKTGGFKTDGGFFNIYIGTDKLKLYYSKKANIIVVLAYGEKQPTLYKLWLEGVWTIS